MLFLVILGSSIFVLLGSVSVQWKKKKESVYSFKIQWWIIICFNDKTLWSGTKHYLLILYNILETLSNHNSNFVLIIKGIFLWSGWVVCWLIILHLCPFLACFKACWRNKIFSYQFQWSIYFYSSITHCFKH